MRRKRKDSQERVHRDDGRTEGVVNIMRNLWFPENNQMRYRKRAWEERMPERERV